MGEDIKEINKRRINVILSPELGKSLNSYCLAYAKKKGRYPRAIKQKIARLAIQEWIQNHGKDFTVLDAEDTEGT